MRISHKRNIQRKLHKQKPLLTNTVSAAKNVQKVETAIETAVVAEVVVASKPVVASKSAATLTPKQQQVLDIIVKHTDGLNPKGYWSTSWPRRCKSSILGYWCVKKIN